MKRFRSRTALFLAISLLTAAVAVRSAPDGISDSVRARLAQNDFAGAAALVQNYRKLHGVTAEGLEAMSWIARGELGRRNLDQAAKWAEDTYQLASAERLKHPLTKDPNAPLALALGASVEVEGIVLAVR